MRRGNILKLSNEWFSPAYLVEAARATMGEIDLDPASTALANKTVKAAMYYTKRDNGLLQPWHGRIYLNPPYGVDEQGHSNLKQFLLKLFTEYQHGHIQQAIALCISDTDSGWFQQLWGYPLCFVNHKIHFNKPALFEGDRLDIESDSRDSQMFGTVFLYLGGNTTAFIKNFSAHGRIVLPLPLQEIRDAYWSKWQPIDQQCRGIRFPAFVLPTASPHEAGGGHTCEDELPAGGVLSGLAESGC